MSHYYYLLPENTSYIVYYGNSYELLHKSFNALEYAEHFVDQLKKEKGLLEFVELRVRHEKLVELKKEKKK